MQCISLLGGKKEYRQDGWIPPCQQNVKKPQGKGNTNILQMTPKLALSFSITFVVVVVVKRLVHQKRERERKDNEIIEERERGKGGKQKG